MKNNKIIQWFLKHSLTIASCVLITGLGIAFLVWSSPGTTTIGENISTGDITASGDVTVSGDLEAKTGRTATLIVAAADSATTSKAQADYVCTGTNDHLEIQAALDALPSGGGEVKLLEGTYYIESSITLDSNQTLRGGGRNTILTTKTADTDIITATGGDGSEKVGIVITDLCVDDTAGGVSSGEGITWTYVDYSRIMNCWSRLTSEEILVCNYCDYNQIVGNTFEGGEGIYFKATSTHNNILNNSFKETDYPIYLEVDSHYNRIVGNIIQDSLSEGIDIFDSG